MAARDDGGEGEGGVGEAMEFAQVAVAGGDEGDVDEGEGSHNRRWLAGNEGRSARATAKPDDSMKAQNRARH